MSTMLWLAKLIVPSTAAGYGLLAAALPTATTIGALIGIASLIGGVAVVSTLRAQLAAAKGTITLAASERDILATKTARLEQRNAYLEAQPNLDKHAKLLEVLTALVIDQGVMLKAIYTSTVPPDHRDPADR